MTDDYAFYKWAQRAVHDGRDMSVPMNKTTLHLSAGIIYDETAELGLSRLQVLPFNDWQAVNIS